MIIMSQIHGLLTKSETKRANERLVANHDGDRRHHWQAQSPNGPELELLGLTHLRAHLSSIYLDLYIKYQSNLFAINIFNLTHK